MGKSVMGGHMLGSGKSGKSYGTSSGGGQNRLPTPSNGVKPNMKPLRGNGGTASAVGGPGGSGGGSKGGGKRGC